MVEKTLLSENVVLSLSFLDSPFLSRFMLSYVLGFEMSVVTFRALE